MEIDNELTFQHITWTVKDFLELPQDSRFNLDSPEFLFGGDTYCLRLCPNVNKKGSHEIEFHVRRLSEIFPENKVSWKVGLRTREPNGDECYEFRSAPLENNSYKRSLIAGNRDEYVPYKNLTVVCFMWLSEESGASSSASGKEDQGRFPGHNASFTSRWSPAKMELTTESPCTSVELTVSSVFNLLREMDDPLISPEFRFAGDAYCLQFQANGDTEDTELQLVRRTSNFLEKTVYYRVGYMKGTSTIYPKSYKSLVGSIGLCVLQSKLEEERENYATCGDLNLVLFLRLSEQSRAGTSDAALKRTELTGIPKLQSDYRQILQKETVSDACLVVQGTEFKVHRVVLCARSKVFKAMFSHDTAEKESKRVVIEDLDPNDFGHFLEYLYTGDIQEKLSDDNAFGLYAAADKYEVDTLKSECVDYMRRTLSVDTFCDFVTLAKRYGEEGLLQQAIRFLRENLQRIIITAKWQQFNIDNAAFVNELFNKALVP